MIVLLGDDVCRIIFSCCSELSKLLLTKVCRQFSLYRYKTDIDELVEELVQLPVTSLIPDYLGFNDIIKTAIVKGDSELPLLLAVHFEDYYSYSARVRYYMFHIKLHHVSIAIMTNKYKFVRTYISYNYTVISLNELAIVASLLNLPIITQSELVTLLETNGIIVLYKYSDDLLCLNLL